MNALSHIRQIDYTVIFARDMPRMQAFYSGIMGFPVLRKLGDGWIEFGVGSNRLALTAYGLIFNDEPPVRGALSMQMAFRVPPAEVEKCAGNCDFYAERAEGFLSPEPVELPGVDAKVVFRPLGTILAVMPWYFPS